MINEIKNISGGQLDWGLGITQENNTLIEVDVWIKAHYDRFCEFVSKEEVEVHGYDDEIINGFDAMNWALYKMQKIEGGGHYPLIYDLVDPFFRGMPFHSIDYKRNLLSGVKLHAKNYFRNDGLLEKTEYYHKYDPQTDTGIIVLTVNAEWVVDESEEIPAAADVIERTKEREWVNTDGSKNSKKKKGKKKYETLEKVQAEGKRRRGNIQATAINKLGLLLVLMGEANDAVEAQDIMLQFHSDYNVEFSDYKEAGKGRLYDKIQEEIDDVNSTKGWMKTIVADNATTQAMIPESIGLTIGEFTKEKLKGKK